MATQEISEFITRYNRLVSERSTWDNHWAEVAERVLPRHAAEFRGGHRQGGEKNTEKQFDSTATLALDKFAAVLESMLVPRGQRWHRLRASLPELNKNRDVLLWFDQVTDILFQFRYRTTANYASQQHEAFMSLGAFGTGGLFIDWFRDIGLRYRAISLADLYLLLNHQGIPDTVFRKLDMTARQMVQRWGRDVVSDQVSVAFEKTPDKEFHLLHVVTPRTDRNPNKVDFRGMPFKSIYLELDSRHKLAEGGYNTFPYPISRYVVGPNETYGRSPAIMALPAIKTLNEEKKAVLKQGHRTVDPVLLAHDDGVLDTFSLQPGAVNFGGVSKEGRPLVQPLQVGNVNAGIELMNLEREVINDAFLVTLFQILTETPRMTATEVLERVREKGVLLSPTMGRQQTELLGPMIERELDLLAQNGLLPPMPEPLIEAEGEYRVEYDSPLSRAQKAESAAGFARTFEMASTIAQNTGRPEALDWFNEDEIIPGVAEIQGMPVPWLRDPNTVKQIRDQRAEALQVQQAIEAAPSLAGAAKAVSGKDNKQ